VESGYDREDEVERQRGDGLEGDEDLVSVYSAPDEFLALSVKALLEEAGIEAEVRSCQIPWYDGIAKMMRPAWGEVVVLARDRDRSMELVDAFLSRQSTTGEPSIEE